MAPSRKLRKLYQGVWNIVRFNWHFYVLAPCLIVIFLTLSAVLHHPYRLACLLGAALAFVPTSISLLVSHWVYDRSKLYTLDWLEAFEISPPKQIINIHAGFDETSSLLQVRFPDSTLKVFDFYDPKKHTEISIKRARRACLPHPGTQEFQTSHIPVPDASVDIVFLLFSAHEIRSDSERVAFFLEVKRVLTPRGVIVVSEHLRDLPNFLAYSFGFFHFLSLATWEETFEGADINITRTTKITPFVTGFLLS